MRRILNPYLAALIVLFLFTQCDSVLDTEPLGDLTSENFFQTERDFEAASLAPYSTMLNLYFEQGGRGWGQGILYPDDDVRNAQGTNEQEEFTWLPSNSHFSWIWSESYKGIMRSNVILDRLPKATQFTDDSKKARFEAEAKFVRAYFYFILARNFGNVPIVDQVITTIEDAEIGNSAPGEVWDLIQSDLSFAAENLPPAWDAGNVGRATSFAAHALHGKVALFRAQWLNQPAKYQEAITHLEAVVNSGQFDLMADYGDNFREATENNQESLFEVQFSRGDFNTWLPTDFGLEGNQNVGHAGSGRKSFMGAGCHVGACAPGANSHGYGMVHATEGLQNAFEEGDPRRLYTIYKHGDVYTTGACDHDNDGATLNVEPCPFNEAWSITGSTPAKYLKPFDPNGFPPNNTTNNERIIRYADVLLMLAEAELLGNGNVSRAAELINRVRARARATSEIVTGAPPPEDLLADRPSAASQDQMMDWLMQERRVELALEAHRYDDLVRWHRAGLINIPTEVDFGNSAANGRWSERNLLKPIPQSDMDANPALTQNTGY